MATRAAPFRSKLMRPNSLQRGAAMSQKDFWGGFGAGAAAGVFAGIGAALTWRALRSGNQEPDILRLEKTVQIGRRVDEVFRAWSDLEALPEHVSMIKRVRSFRSRARGTES